MSIGMKQRQLLRQVIGKPPTTLLTGMPWTRENNADSHGSVHNFLARQVARGLKPRSKV